MRTAMKKVVESATARLGWLIGPSLNDVDGLSLSPADQAQVAQLTHMVGRLKEVCVPVTPRSDFQARLKERLLAAASQRLAAEKESRVSALRNRWVLVGAAAASALSVAGIVAAVLFHQRIIRL